MPDCKLYCLGRPILEMDGGPVRLEMRKSLALLIYLRMAEHDCSRESLSTLFWPEYDQRHAQANLRRVLSSLNKSLRGELLEADREKIGLKDRSKIWLDVECFQGLLSTAKNHIHADGRSCLECLYSLESAIRLHRGSFLQGFHAARSPAFDEWQTIQCEYLRLELSAALQKAIQIHTFHGQWEPAIQHARQWVGLDRLDEAAQRALISLYTRAGQPRAAIGQYEELRHLLQDELGQEPEEETRALLGEIRAPRHATSRPSAAAPSLRSSLGKTLEERLLKTKLYIPSTRPRQVSRLRLVQLLEEVDQKTLTLISAPAGFGKTALLAEWIAFTSLPVAWISLDAGENSAGLFLEYLTVALQAIQENLGAETRQMLEAHAPVPPQIILSGLLNDLEQCRESFALVLDDYQFISNPSVHELMSYLLEHAPRAMHLVISTRIDPPFSLARLRSLDKLLEVRAAELRFTPQETDDFFNRTMELGLSAEDIRILTERTEGWVVGMQMAAISLKNRVDTTAFIRAFSGSNRYILDYLVEEVLSRQPENVKAFLMQTSILDRLCGPLCDAILGETGASPSQSILEQIDRENLFLFSLDDERCWFRYHHLFADLLRTRLDHFHHDDLPRLHLRASEWYEQNHLMEEAIKHAISAQAQEQAGRLISQLVEPTIARSGSSTMQQWIQQLPDRYVRSQPWLCIGLGWVYVECSQLDLLEEYLREAERHVRPEDPPLLKKEWLAHILTLRSLAANMRGDFAETIRLGNQALTLIRRENVGLRMSLGYNLGRAFFALGDFSHAYHLLWETVQLSMQTGPSHVLAPSIGTISKGLRIQGRLHETIEKLRESQIYLEEHSPTSIYAAGLAYLGTIDVLREWNQLEQAEQLARQTLDSLERWKSINSTCPCATHLARILQAQGRLGEAHRALQFAAQTIRGHVPFGDIRSDLNAAWVKYWLAAGELPLAEQWMDGWLKNHVSGGPFSIVAERDEITVSRVLIARKEYEQASEMLSRLAESAEAGGRTGRLIEILALLAVALYASNKSSQALTELEKCLMLAKPEGYLRIFLDEGKSLGALLTQGKHQGCWNTGPLGEYVDQLLNAFGEQEACPFMPQNAGS